MAIFGFLKFSGILCQSKMISSLLFDLALIAVILDFTHNALSKVPVGHKTMSGIDKNPMVDTKVMNFVKIISIYRLTLHKWRPSWILPHYYMCQYVI